MQGQLPTPSSSTTHERIESSDNARRVTAMGTTTSEDDIGQSRNLSDAFYGSSSAASFLKEACSTINPQLAGDGYGNPQATTAKPPPFYSGIETFVLPPRPLADHLIERYFQRVYYLYPIFDKEAFDHAYKSLWLPRGQNTHTDTYKDLGIGEDSTTIAFH